MRNTRKGWQLPTRVHAASSGILNSQQPRHHPKSTPQMASDFCRKPLAGGGNNARWEIERGAFQLHIRKLGSWHTQCRMEIGMALAQVVKHNSEQFDTWLSSGIVKLQQLARGHKTC